MIFEQITIYATLLIASANIIIIYFYFMQLRETKKPIILTKFISAEKGNGSKQEIMEKLPQYLFVENNSKNKIENLKIKGVFYFKEKKFTINKKVSYVNPFERIKILIRLGDLIEKYPNLFEEYKTKREGSEVILKIPKETLKIRFELIFKWKLFYKQKDYYEIEWLSKKSCPDLKYHPNIHSWNKRGEHYVEKIEDRREYEKAL